MKPIKPEEILKLKETILPDQVIEAVNEIIAENYNNGTSSFFQKDLIAKIISKMKDDKITDSDVFKNKWLNIESIYRNNGWKVSYDKPGYNESYEPSFTFTAKKT